VFRVPKSYNAPHQIKIKELDAYYGRRATGIYAMDVETLRQAFILSETRTERIRMFKDERIQRIFTVKPHLPLYDNAKTVLHLIPIDAFDPGKRYDDIDIIYRDKEALKPMFRYGSYEPFFGFRMIIERRYNLDGISKYSTFMGQVKNDAGQPSNYIEPYTCVRLFRNGIIEAIELRELNREYESGLVGIWIDEYEKAMITEILPNYLNTLKILGVTAPVFLFLTLCGVRGYNLLRNTIFYEFDRKIDRDIVTG
jgi:hypothetical protein